MRTALAKLGDRLETAALWPWRAAALDGAKGRVLDALIPWYLRIRAKDGRLTPLKPNAAQRAYAARRGKRNIILKARQLGMTTYLAGRLFLATLLRPGTVSLLIAHSLESAQQIFRIVHRFYAHLPEEMRAAAPLERANVREVAFATIDSRLRVDTAGNPAAGRGLTLTHLHCSEVAEWPGDPAATMAALTAALVPGGTVDLESTPKGMGGFFHSEWMLAQSGDSGYVPHFFPWWMEPAYRSALVRPDELQPLTEEERGLVARYSLDPQQIKFRRQTRKSMGALAPQEYAENPAECFLASGNPVFDVERIDERARNCSPLNCVQRHNGAEWEFWGPVEARRYIVAADVAEGRGDGDFSVAQVIDRASGHQALEMQVRWPIERFAVYLADLAKRYNEALIAVERNNHGHAVLYALQHRHNYPWLYRHAEAGVPGQAGAEGAYGWPTNAQTKPQVIGALTAMLADAPAAFESSRLLSELRAVQYDRNGGAGAPPGLHDDLVMAMGIALAVRGRTPLPMVRQADLEDHDHA